MLFTEPTDVPPNFITFISLFTPLSRGPLTDEGSPQLNRRQSYEKSSEEQNKLECFLFRVQVTSASMMSKLHLFFHIAMFFSRKVSILLFLT